MRKANSAKVICALGLLMAKAGSANAAQIYWTDWLGSNSGATSSPFTGNGLITTPTSTVNVTYFNANGIGFYQASGGTDYWTPRTPLNLSPYTSSAVDNVPTGTDIVALQFAGSQTLSFSQAIANPVFSYVSLNGNGYAFLNQDFNILSYDGGVGNVDPIGANNCGFWGCGTSFKQVVPIGGGNVLYELLGTGEPHGTIQFTGAFNSVTWTSLSNEYWNGFTVGVQGTAAEIFPPTEGVPEPATLTVFGVGLAAAAMLRRRKSNKA